VNQHKQKKLAQVDSPTTWKNPWPGMFHQASAPTEVVLAGCTMAEEYTKFFAANNCIPGSQVVYIFRGGLRTPNYNRCSSIP
jgi:hypothetical protein